MRDQGRDRYRRSVSRQCYHSIDQNLLSSNGSIDEPNSPTDGDIMLQVLHSSEFWRLCMCATAQQQVSDSTSANGVREGHENGAVMPKLSDPASTRLGPGPEASLSESSLVSLLLFFPTISALFPRSQASSGQEQLGRPSCSRLSCRFAQK